MSTPVARVLLVGFEDQDNLGLRYLSARLREAGHEPRLFTIRKALTESELGARELLRAERDFAPQVIGFSLIFQFLSAQYGALMGAMREAGVETHFTVGGHYPSFEPENILRLIPQLDSVCRFEAEDTLVELAEAVVRGAPWREVPGIAYQQDGEAIIGSPRTARASLDGLPWPDRDDIDYRSQRLPTASIIGGRGCPWKCSFCSIITFYRDNGTPGRRLRDPTDIVDEIESLHDKHGVRILLWQDDDFLAGGRGARRWAREIAEEMIGRGLHRRLRWKISCRSDETTEEALRPLVEAGLRHVYLGVESGAMNDLVDLNKLLEPGAHLDAGNVLRRLGLSFDFGFMLLEPWSTLDSVRQNVRFLREFVGDGASVVGFCRALPYAGTPMATKLREEGRLIEDDDLNVDYNFLDPRLDVFYDWTLAAFGERNFAPEGTYQLLRRAGFEANLDLEGIELEPGLRSRVRRLTRLSNQLVLDTLEEAVEHLEETGPVSPDDEVLGSLARVHEHHDALIRRDLVTVMRSALRSRWELAAESFDLQ